MKRNEIKNYGAKKQTVEPYLKGYREARARLMLLEAERSGPLPDEFCFDPDQGYKSMNADELLREARTARSKGEAARLREQILAAEAMLLSLNERERFVVETYYIQGYRWADVERLYAERMRFWRSPLYLWQVRMIAIDKMYGILEGASG